jgi:hypothetical protein
MRPRRPSATENPSFGTGIDRSLRRDPRRSPRAAAARPSASLCWGTLRDKDAHEAPVLDNGPALGFAVGGALDVQRRGVGLGR